MSASSTPLLAVFWDELLFTGCWVFGRWQKVSKTKFFADASIIESAYILKASTENFAKVQYLKTRTEVMMDPITRQLKKRRLWNCWCCLRWRGWRWWWEWGTLTNIVGGANDFLDLFAFLDDSADLSITYMLSRSKPDGYLQFKPRGHTVWSRSWETRSSAQYSAALCPGGRCSWKCDKFRVLSKYVGISCNARFPWRKENSTWRGCKTRPPTAAAWSLGRPGNVET